MLYILGFVATFVIGGVTGVMFSAIPFDQATTDSMFVVAHLHYVLVGGAVFPMLAAIHHWGPKMTGRMLDDRLGKISFWLVFVGFNLNMFPLHILGMLGQPRRTYTYARGLGWDIHNLISTIGAFMLGLGILAIVVNWFRSKSRGATAGDDPWGGETLEWATTSPPPHYNFVTVPTVRSKEPMWDQPELPGGQPTDQGGYALDEGHTTLSTSLLDAEPQAIVHMPHETPWPFYLSVCLAALFYALLLDAYAVAVVAAVASASALMGWFWPRGETQET
jgi:cytochrome c oxidase subunit 1/cytochrome c oxidase subunit I+III